MTASAHRQQYQFWTRLASSAAVIAALCMITIKAIAWYMSDSAAMLASLTDSVFDVAASIINFFVLRYALLPADDDHRFGHGKAESLAGLAQAAFIMGSAMLLILHSIDRLKHPQPIDNGELAVYATIASVVITLALVALQIVAVQRTKSVAIKADSMHYRSDLLMNLAILLSLWLTMQGYYSVDGWFAIAIALYLIWGAKDIALESAAALMDKELPPEFTADIERIVCAHPRVHGVHAVRTRQAGHTKFVQLHLELDDKMPLLEAHGITDAVEEAIMRAYPEADVLIHQDPISIVRDAQVNA